MSLIYFLLSLGAVMLLGTTFLIGALWGIMWVFIWAMRSIFKEGD